MKELMIEEKRGKRQNNLSSRILESIPIFRTGTKGKLALIRASDSETIRSIKDDDSSYSSSVMNSSRTERTDQWPLKELNAKEEEAKVLPEQDKHEHEISREKKAWGCYDLKIHVNLDKLFLIRSSGAYVGRDR